MPIARCVSKITFFQGAAKSILKPRKIFLALPFLPFPFCPFPLGGHHRKSPVTHMQINSKALTPRTFLPSSPTRSSVCNRAIHPMNVSFCPCQIRQAVPRCKGRRIRINRGDRSFSANRSPVACAAFVDRKKLILRVSVPGCVQHSLYRNAASPTAVSNKFRMQ